MDLITDLHLHSRYSQACSRNISIDNLEKWGKIKGLNLLGTSDFTHPEWINEIKNKLKEEGNGILRTKEGFPFILSSEISLIYKQGGKGRRVHHILLAPSLEIVEQITNELLKWGRVDYDGRPIFGKSCVEFVEKMKGISGDIEIVPAHCLTPWFSLFGSNSGFDSIQECYGDQAKHIYSIETGLSSDPEMNWRLSQLDNKQILSFSDSHAFWPFRLGREATIFNFSDLTYKNLIKAIRTGEGLSSTIEVDPSYGKYHFDGHRKCGVCMHPKDSINNKNLCPKCGRILTIGVLHRVEELADREEGYVPKNAKPFFKLLPLSEIIAGVTGRGLNTQGNWSIYYKLTREFKSEFDILMRASKEELDKIIEPNLVDAILRNRIGDLEVKPGFDGEYGEPLLSSFVGNVQKSLVEF